MNLFCEPVAVTAGRYYIGYENTSSNRVLVGLDLNTNHADKMFTRRFSDPWEKASDKDVSGIMTIHPVVSSFELNTNRFTENYSPKIFPNPSSGILHLEKGIESVQVYTVDGQLIYNNSQLDEMQIDLSDKNKGMYLVKMTKDHTSYTAKVIIN